MLSYQEPADYGIEAIKLGQGFAKGLAKDLAKGATFLASLNTWRREDVRKTREHGIHCHIEFAFEIEAGTCF